MLSVIFLPYLNQNSTIEVFSEPNTIRIAITLAYKIILLSVI
jgi:hypothetical protein